MVPPRRGQAGRGGRRRAQGTSAAATMMAHPDIRGSQSTAGAPPQESKPMGAASVYGRAFAAHRGERGFSPAWPPSSPALVVAPSAPVAWSSLGVAVDRRGRPGLGGLLRGGAGLGQAGVL